jgi:hypothetical protein
MAHDWASLTILLPARLGGKRLETPVTALRNDYRRGVATGATAEYGASRGARFALAKFRPTTLPATLITRPVLHERP